VLTWAPPNSLHFEFPCNAQQWSKAYWGTCHRMVKKLTRRKYDNLVSCQTRKPNLKKFYIERNKHYGLHLNFFYLTNSTSSSTLRATFTTTKLNLSFVACKNITLHTQGAWNQWHDGREKDKRKTWIGLIDEQRFNSFSTTNINQSNSTTKVAHYTTLTPHFLEVTKFS